MKLLIRKTKLFSQLALYLKNISDYICIFLSVRLRELKIPAVCIRVERLNATIIFMQATRAFPLGSHI